MEVTKCDICFEKGSDGTFMLLKMDCCGQTLHKSCLLKWIVKRPSGTQATCPFCRQTVEDISKYATYQEIFTFLKRNSFRISGISAPGQRAQHTLEVVVPDADTRTPSRTRYRTPVVTNYKIRCIVMIILISLVIVGILIWQGHKFLHGKDF